jgi:hypothetical protein
MSGVIEHTQWHQKSVTETVKSLREIDFDALPPKRALPLTTMAHVSGPDMQKVADENVQADKFCTIIHLPPKSREMANRAKFTDSGFDMPPTRKERKLYPIAGGLIHQYLAKEEVAVPNYDLNSQPMNRTNQFIKEEVSRNQGGMFHEAADQRVGRYQQDGPLEAHAEERVSIDRFKLITKQRCRTKEISNGRLFAESGFDMPLRRPSNGDATTIPPSPESRRVKGGDIVRGVARDRR